MAWPVASVFAVDHLFTGFCKPDDVSNTENEVNIARERYNEALQTYNTALQLFPNNIVAAMSGFTRNDAYFHTETGAGQGAKMQF